MQGFYDRTMLAYFVACDVSRLTRYMVTAEAMQDGTGNVKHFEGAPNPALIVLVTMMAVAVWFGALRQDLCLVDGSSPGSRSTLWRFYSRCRDRSCPAACASPSLQDLAIGLKRPHMVAPRADTEKGSWNGAQQGRGTRKAQRPATLLEPTRRQLRLASRIVGRSEPERHDHNPPGGERSEHQPLHRAFRHCWLTAGLAHPINLSISQTPAAVHSSRPAVPGE